jgi:hypothetical protein
MVSRAPAALVLAAAAGISLAPGAGAQPESLGTDDRGFIDTAARCEQPTFAVAFGRTQRSLVAICVQDGAYEYRGVRLRDEAFLTADAVAIGDGRFSAENGGVTYTFSAKELVVTVGDRVVRSEPMVAYVEPRLAAEE